MIWNSPMQLQNCEDDQKLRTRCLYHTIIYSLIYLWYTSLPRQHSSSVSSSSSLIFTSSSSFLMGNLLRNKSSSSSSSVSSSFTGSYPAYSDLRDDWLVLLFDSGRHTCMCDSYPRLQLHKFLAFSRHRLGCWVSIWYKSIFYPRYQNCIIDMSKARI